jgi:predicted nucleic acid-binding protein
MIVLDTNVVSELMKARPDEQVHKWLRSLGDMRLTTTSVSVAEIEYGLQRLPDGRRKTELQDRFTSLIEALTVLPLDDIAGLRAGQLRAQRDHQGMPATASDMMIAGIATTANAPLATRNVKDFDGLQVQVIDPWRAN